MTRSLLNILIADDDEGDRAQIKRALHGAGLAFSCVETQSVAEALAACDKIAFECAIIDYRMPGHDGLHGIAALHQRLPYMCIVMATGQGDEIVATEAMKRGASDYIAKSNINAASIRQLIDSAMANAALRRQVAEQREELENFAAVLVHDLKSPTRTIRQFVQLIEESNGMGRPEKAAAYLHYVSQAAQRLDALIDTLRDYTKAGEHAAFSTVEMSVALTDAMANLRHEISARSAHVTHDALPRVIGNAPQLAQLLQNLIGNGIKYCEAATPTIHVAAEANGGDTWRFAVTDNGIGIAKESHGEVFNAFRRLHGAGKYEGTGLGLATCKKIVERHGGVIGCASEPGQGTTFFFTLPGAGAPPQN
jgi:signal transduction histidine kinase